LPAAEPGAAVSPGIKSCNFFNAPALMVVADPVLGVIVPLKTSVAVTVCVPAALPVTLKVLDPETKAALFGNIAFRSLHVMATVSVILIRFQFVSTARTVTVNDEPAIWAEGEPVLPVVVPGAGVSPGIKSCNCATGPTAIMVKGHARTNPATMPVNLTNNLLK